MTRPKLSPKTAAPVRVRPYFGYEPTRVLGVHISRASYEEVRRHARRQKLSISELVRRALQRELDGELS